MRNHPDVANEEFTRTALKMLAQGECEILANPVAVARFARHPIDQPSEILVPHYALLLGIEILANADIITFDSRLHGKNLTDKPSDDTAGSVVKIETGELNR